jgi:hypothetical protein
MLAKIIAQGILATCMLSIVFVKSLAWNNI